MAYTFKHGDRPVDGYTIQRAVGRGGFGEVYYSISDGGREVAIKYLRDNPQVELRGVSNCINLKSPHLVAIFDVKKTVDDEYAIIMEYCSGPSLRDLLIAEPRGFGPQKAAFFLREIAKGLSYLHDRGIVHRDLKPGNIFYDDGYVKIGDYGLSKFIAISRHSAQTASVGTVHYMAPEIGSGNYSKGVDIYALGVMLYEMLLGKVPFEGSSLAEVLMKHLTAQPEIDDLPQPFGQVIRKALEKDPKDRYQSVDEMVADLLEVEEVRDSLAGFRPQSLQQAVRRGTPQRLDSPIPSPNPPPTFGQPPFAQPVTPTGPLPVGVPLSGRLAKKMNRISRKMESKMAKLGGRRPTPGHSGGAPPHVGEAAAAVTVPIQDRKKRILLSGLLSMGLAIGLGILIGNAAGGSEEMGASAGMLVILMSLGVLGARSAVNWFGVLNGPAWTRHLIRLCCCAPLMAIGAAPMFSSPRYSDQGLAIWIGLLALCTFAKWDKFLCRSSTGEMSFASAMWHAFSGLALTAMASGAISGTHGTSHDPAMFLAAGVAGAVSLIIQATSWWFPATAARAVEGLAGNTGWEASAALPPQSANLGQGPGQTPPAGAAGRDNIKTRPPSAEQPVGSESPRVRWAVTRAFWGIATFGLIGGTITTFVLTLVADNISYEERTGIIVGCVATASFMIFALRRTAPLKRDGFWLETARPFLISLTMFGIGGTITAISREWNSGGDEERVAMVAGLVMSSFWFLVLLFFRGRRRRPPQSFLTGSPAPSPAPVGAGAALAGDFADAGIGFPKGGADHGEDA